MTPQLASAIATVLASVTASAVAIIHTLAYYKSKTAGTPVVTQAPASPIGQFGKPGS